MPRRAEPMLARRPSSQNSGNSGDQGIAEEDALLTGQSIARERPTWQRWREIGVFVWAMVMTIVVIVLAVAYEQSQAHQNEKSGKPNGKRNLIFMVSDGMGPTSLSLTRSYRQFTEGLPWSDTLAIDRHIIGQSRTRSTSSLVTDSAAGATAFSCGLKSYNGAIAMLPDHTPCGTVMEAAKRAGYLTGLVVTTRITDATPACFAAHVNRREEEDRIAEQLLGEYPLGQTVDLMLGAGRCHFLPNSTEGSCRSDNRDLITMAKRNNITYIDSRKDFDDLKHGSPVQLPLLGLFADHDIPYEVDRRTQNDIYPSLVEMANTALAVLSEASRDQDKGFFLMIEGSRIDHAGHSNDAVAQVHEVLAYDATISAVLDFLEKDKTDGIMISTSDHETGGLSTAKELDPFVYPQYRWYPGVLANASRSSEWLTNEYAKHFRETSISERDATAFVRDAIPKYLGIHDATDEEVELIVDRPVFAPWLFADIVSRRSQIGWSTHGHSAADVNIYTSNPAAAKALVGSHENTEVGEFLREYLDVDVDAITKELQEKGVLFDFVDEQGKKISWTGKRPAADERLDGQAHLDHYQGDFKKHKRCEICGV